MEAFDGIFIASTNLIDMLDAACLRRSNFKIRFDALRRDQRRALLARICGDSAKGTALEVANARLDRLEALTAGDYANVLRQLQVTGELPEPVRFAHLLGEEVAMKQGQRMRPIGFAPD